QRGGVHDPAASADALVGVEIGDMVGLGGHIGQGTEGAGGVELDAALFLIAHAGNAAERFAGFDVLHYFEEGVLALADDHGIDAVGGEGLVGEERRVPPAEDDGQVRIELFHLPGHVHSFANHGPGDQRYGQ